MEFQRFISDAVASDGGTISCRALLGDGTHMDCGLDRRLCSNDTGQRIFVGAGHPAAAGARMLQRGSAEELAFINALRQYLCHQSEDSVAAHLLTAIMAR
jgi:hypothetical protein